jgi:superfamily II DNA or RNA helicase
MTAPFQLRPYQNEAIEAIRRAFLQGARSALAVLPTGAGKTVLFAELCRRAGARRTLIVVHRHELLTQAAKKIEGIAGLAPGIEQGKQRAAAEDSVVVASIQSLAKGRQIADGRFGLCVIDEAHHAAALSYRQVLKRLAPAYLLGVTATPDRDDQHHLSSVFETVAYSLTLFDLIK